MLPWELICCYFRRLRYESTKHITIKSTFEDFAVTNSVMQKTSIAHPHITLETVTEAAVEAEVAVKILLKQKKVLLKMLCRC
jgi:hypothetical protein